MKKYLLHLFLATAILTPTIAKTTGEIVQTTQNPSLLGKYIVVKEDREIIRNGKKTESTTEVVEDGLIYHFKSTKLVTVFWEEGESGIDFKIKRNGNTYELINENGEAEDDTLILKKNSAKEVVFVRESGDGDEEGEILVRSIFYLKPIK